MKAVVERYCKAWNGADLEGIFALFSQDAEYRGPAKHLRGRAAIREMYRHAFETGVARGLVARPIQLKRGTWGVVLYRHGDAVALKEFLFSGGLIAAHDLVEDPATIAQEMRDHR